MAISNEEAIARWVRDCATGGLQPRRGYSSGSIYPAEGNALMYERKARWNRQPWGPVALCTWAPETRTFVLNGDGFTDRNATTWQSNIRFLVQNGTRREPGANWVRLNLPPEIRYVLVPYAAMRAAGIDPLTVRPIDVTEDEWENIRHEVGPAPPLENFQITEGQTGSESRFRECTFDGRRWRTTERLHRYWVNGRGERRSYPPHDDRASWTQESEWVQSNRFSVVDIASTGEGGWRQVQPNGTEYWWQEDIHHLGGSVFSAADGNGGGRKRYISGFDQDEPRQMYFLAQLPNRGRISTYREAVAALAPPIIHSSRAKGIDVRRQGDVFAVATERTDKWVYDNRLTRVRRDVALHDPTRQGVTPPEMDELDYKERSICPCCGAKAKAGWGPRSRRALMIYGTSHTATEVVVVKGGAVYMRGQMHHDPHLEEPGRRPEHVVVTLGDQRTWYLAVRNTVPRRKSNGNREEEAA